MSREYRGYYTGRKVKVLFEEMQEAEGEACMTGYTPEYVRVMVPGMGEEMKGKIGVVVGGVVMRDGIKGEG